MLRSTVAVAGAAVLALGVAGVVVAQPAQDEASTFVEPAAVGEVDLDGMLTHLEAFQAIADDNGGNRAAGTSGYAASADYVANLLDAAGFDVTRQPCDSCRHGDDNVIADWAGGDTDHTVMLGAHLDGVTAGPGINDNGSGSAALLELALTFAEADPDLPKHVRFAWWAEEELGMHGSTHYVETVGVDDLDVYLNLDMVAGTNAGFFVDNINGQQSAAMAAHLAAEDMPAEEMTDCCSDNRPFEQAGVPSSLLSTGYGELKTAAQVEKWGGEAGEPFDPCYHTACDTYPENIDTGALSLMAGAAAAGLWDNAERPIGAYEPVAVCGAGYVVQEREPLQTGDGETVGEVYMLWNGSAGLNCAVTIKLADLGTATETSVLLESEDDRSETDSGAFGYYAGPVTLDAAGTCVSVTGTMAHDGENLSATIPMSHCG